MTLGVPNSSDITDIKTTPNSVESAEAIAQRGAAENVQRTVASQRSETGDFFSDHWEPMPFGD